MISQLAGCPPKRALWEIWYIGHSFESGNPGVLHGVLII